MIVPALAEEMGRQRPLVCSCYAGFLHWQYGDKHDRALDDFDAELHRRSEYVDGPLGLSCFALMLERVSGPKNAETDCFSVAVMYLIDVAGTPLAQLEPMLPACSSSDRDS